MIKQTMIQELTDKLSQLFPDNMNDIRQDIKQQIHQLLQSRLNDLNLVTREEFDVQVKVLQKTRAKLQELETQVFELERQLNEHS